MTESTALSYRRSLTYSGPLHLPLTMYINSGSSWGQFYSSEDTWQCLRTFLGITNDRDVLLVSNR